MLQEDIVVTTKEYLVSLELSFQSTSQPDFIITKDEEGVDFGYFDIIDQFSICGSTFKRKMIMEWYTLPLLLLLYLVVMLIVLPVIYIVFFASRMQGLNPEELEELCIMSLQDGRKTDLQILEVIKSEREPKFWPVQGSVHVALQELIAEGLVSFSKEVDAVTMEELIYFELTENGSHWQAIQSYDPYLALYRVGRPGF